MTKKLLTVCASLIALLAIGSAAAAGAGNSVASAVSSGAAIPQQTCFWNGPAASKFDTNPENNYAFPDSGAIYWAAKFTMPAGSRIVLRGRYAHARYTSLNTYNLANNAPVDALNDVHTKPDKGSTNPFRLGNRRDLPRRSYSVRVLNQTVPATRAPNALYAGVTGQPQQAIIYRLYVPDSFRQKDLTGGVGLPVPELHLADGTVQRGSAACNTLQTQSGRLSITTLPESLYASLRNQPGKPATFPATPTPTWRAYYNTGFTISCSYLGDCTGNPVRTGGQYSNIDNSYISAMVSRGFAAGPVLVLRGKLPSTPRTGLDVKRMGKGQLRYWSICQNESLYTTRGAGCLYDTEVPVDRHGNYTIVTSKGGDRPSNARTKCGVGYLPWPKNGDGYGNLDDGLLILRNMLPAANFHRAVQDTKTPGDEAQVMGPYLPRGTYTTKAAFQQRGC